MIFKTNNSDKEITTSILASEISKFKNSMIFVDEAKKNASDKRYMQIADVYEKYEKYLIENNLVDFDDLLLLTFKILDNNELSKKVANPNLRSDAIISLKGELTGISQKGYEI